MLATNIDFENVEALPDNIIFDLFQSENIYAPIEFRTYLLEYLIAHISELDAAEILRLTQMHEAWYDEEALRNWEFARAYFDLEGYMTGRKIQLGILVDFPREP